MVEVRALPAVVSPGDVLTIVVREFNKMATVTDASINLARVDEDYTGFAFGWGAKPTLKGSPISVERH